MASSNVFTVAVANSNDASVIVLSKYTMNTLGIHRGDTVLVKGKKQRDTVLIVLESHELGLDQARIHKDARRNLRVKVDDAVVVHLSPTIKYAIRVAINPVADDITSVPPDLFQTFLAPYFREAYRPVRKGDYFTVRQGAAEAEFKITAVEPGEAAIVSQDTIIHSEGDPVQHEAPNAAEDGYGGVGGCTEQIAQLRAAIELPLRYPHLLPSLGARPPRGVMLRGPRGTGKTLVAHAVARESGAFFFLIGCQIEFCAGVEPITALDTVFNEMKANAPAVLFIDDIDRMEKCYVARLLKLVDGLQVDERVSLLAASSRPDKIDPALRQLGRFDCEVEFTAADEIGRRHILEIHTERLKLAPDVRLEELARRLGGWSGSGIASLCSEAAIQLVRRNMDGIEISSDGENVDQSILKGLAVSRADFEAAIPKVRRLPQRDD